MKMTVKKPFFQTGQFLEHVGMRRVFVLVVEHSIGNFYNCFVFWNGVVWFETPRYLNPSSWKVLTKDDAG